MKSITLYPGAKINIGLYVFEKRADGFHELESIFYPVGPENSNLEPDVLTVTVFSDKEEFCSCLSDDCCKEKDSPGSGSQKVVMVETGLEYPGNPEDNICVKAYNLLDADYQLPPAVIVLEKHLPVGAGLGGGSSDGVCTLKALNELCNLNLTLEQLTSYAEKLGSDCPFFVQNKPSLVTGRGENLTPLTDFILAVKEEKQKESSRRESCGESPISKALKNIGDNYTIQIAFSPDCFVSTKKAYSIVPKRKKMQAQSSAPADSSDFSGNPDKPYIALTELITEPVERWQGRIVNDFEEPVFKEFPQLEKVKASMKETGAVYVSMTGSGSAIFGLFPSRPSRP